MIPTPANVASRLWARDLSLWNTPLATHEEIAHRLGWLDAADWMTEHVPGLVEWASRVRQSGRYERVILLGMGGSSLAPAVLASLFSERTDGLPLTVVDTTCPSDIARAAADGIDRALFIASSKSGTTVETVDLLHHFERLLTERGVDPAASLVAVTDPGSWLEAQARAGRIGELFLNPADIGGRYSALSYFGLVPAALLGVDLDRLATETRAFIDTTRADDSTTNEALQLGQYLGTHAVAGRDKLLLDLPGSLQSLGMWIEQLVAESTGKQGQGVLPVIRSSQTDTLTVAMSDGTVDEASPPLSLEIDNPYRIGAEFFRWEFATAVAAAHLGINPFDEPNVAEAKHSTRLFIEGHEALALDPVLETDDFDLSSMDGDLSSFLATLVPGSYLALLAYLPEEEETGRALESLATEVAAPSGLPHTLGWGPRYLHSTGQLHKGGPATGRFIQLVEDGAVDFPVPERDYSFERLFRAQADGDYAVLARKGLPVLRVHLKGDRLRALAGLAATVRAARTGYTPD